MKQHKKVRLVVLASLLMAIVLDYLFPSDFSFVQAQLIGVLATGAGVVTPFTGRGNLDNCIMIGDVDTAMPLSGLQVSIAGKGSTINVTGSQPLISAFAKFMMQGVAATVGLLLQIATGKINKTTDIKLTNAGATTPNIYNFSDAADGMPVYFNQIGINPSSFQDFRQFSALFITPSANVGSIDIEYMDGHTESQMSVLEVDSLLVTSQFTEANGRLDAVVTTIDNRPFVGRPIRRVRVNATTAVTVAVLNLNENDWQALKASGLI